MIGLRNTTRKLLALTALWGCLAVPTTLGQSGGDLEEEEGQVNGKCPSGGNCHLMQCSMGKCMCYRPPGGTIDCYQWCNPCGPGGPQP